MEPPYNLDRLESISNQGAVSNLLGFNFLSFLAGLTMESKTNIRLKFNLTVPSKSGSCDTKSLSGVVARTPQKLH